jgi:hypothetical protein
MRALFLIPQQYFLYPKLVYLKYIYFLVGIATAYGLDGPRIESRRGRDFPHLSRPALRPTQPPVKWVPGLSRGYGADGAWRWPLNPC